MVEYMLASDRAYDGKFIVGVKTTGIFCLPSCHPPRKPKPDNVVFYATPEDARAAGLRACKLCHPDDFYMGFDFGEALVEKLVAAVEHDPGAFQNVGALAATAGVGASKLHELFRIHYHATPAEILARARVAAARRALLQSEQQIVAIAFATGFESLSAFNENFRKYTAMSPRQYRHLPEKNSFTLALPADYSITRILAYLGRDRQSLTERVVGNVYTAALRLDAMTTADDVVALVRVEFAPGIARCQMLMPTDLTAATYAQLCERLLRVLGLASDPARFEAHIAGSAALAPLIDGQQGLRVPLIADPFDGIVRAIIGQQITLGFAATLRRRLIELVSAEIAEGIFAPPTPARVAALDVADLSAISFSAAKARYLIGAAQAVLDGRLPLATLAHASATRIERTLLGLHGIGPWSAHYLMMRSFGFLDCVPVGDTGLTAGLQRFFALKERPDKRETLDLMSHFRPYRSLATFHLWQRQGTSA